jgi:hypothetical protein
MSLRALAPIVGLTSALYFPSVGVPNFGGLGWGAGCASCGDMVFPRHCRVSWSTHEVLPGVELGEPQLAGASVVWLQGRAGGRAVRIEVTEARECVRTVTQTVRYHRVSEVLTGEECRAPCDQRDECTVGYFAAPAGKDRVVQVRAPALHGVCTRPAGEREVRLRLLADEPPAELPEIVVRTNRDGRAVIELPSGAPATGAARLQVDGVKPLELRWDDRRDLLFSRRMPPGALRQGPVWSLALTPPAPSLVVDPYSAEGPRR